MKSLRTNRRLATKTIAPGRRDLTAIVKVRRRVVTATSTVPARVEMAKALHRAAKVTSRDLVLAMVVRVVKVIVPTARPRNVPMVRRRAVMAKVVVVRRLARAVPALARRARPISNG